MRRTEKLLKELNTSNKVINTQTIFREEFLREISWIHKLIKHLDRRSKSLQ